MYRENCGGVDLLPLFYLLPDDKILVLNKGQVVGFDDWDSLKRNYPSFRQLVDMAQAASSCGKPEREQ